MHMKYVGREGRREGVETVNSSKIACFPVGKKLFDLLLVFKLRPEVLHSLYVSVGYDAHIVTYCK